MTWIPLLLSHPSPCFRHLVLTKLLERGDDDLEVRETAELRDEDPLLLELADLQEQNGSWSTLSKMLPPKGHRMVTTSVALSLLGMLGFGPEHPVVDKGAAYIFDRQRKDGSWPIPRGVKDAGTDRYTIMSIQTSIPLQGLSAAGYAEDPRSISAYRWLLEQRLQDGAWPTGLAGKVYGYVAGYRRMSHSRWGCRINTTSALICFSRHPEMRSSEEARKALDLLLGRETREIREFGHEISRLMGAVSTGGFLTFHRHFDIVLILNLCAGIGAHIDDPRVESLVKFIKDRQNPHGLWIPPGYPHMAHWVTLDLLLSLRKLDENTGWTTMEPRTPFSPYPTNRKRF